MKIRTILLTVIMTISVSIAFSQSEKQETDNKKHLIGSSFFMLMNFDKKETPNFYLLNYGYRLTSKDVILIEVKTWNYYKPLGIPYGKEMSDLKNNFPGKVRAYGIGLSYKRYLWKGAYSQIHSTIFKQDYLDNNNTKIQSGIQLFNELRFGYHFKLFKNRMYIEPSIAFTYWPINSNLPNSFQSQENKWNNYFLFEPGLNFGFNF